jgi:hypothetical protein
MRDFRGNSFPVCTGIVEERINPLHRFFGSFSKHEVRNSQGTGGGMEASYLPLSLQELLQVERCKIGACRAPNSWVL